jgi:hypothetical protein
MTHIKSYWDKSADVARGEGASRTDPGNFDMMMVAMIISYVTAKDR